MPLEPTQYQRLWEPARYRRPTTVALARDGFVAVIVRSAVAGEERVLLIRPSGQRNMLPPIPNDLIGRHIRSYTLTSDGRKTYAGGRLQDIVLTDEGKVIVTFAFPFSGGFGGLAEASYAWEGRAWFDVLPSANARVSTNTWVAAASRSSTAFVTDALDQSPAWIGTEEAAGADVSAAVILLRNGAIVPLGHGVATDLADGFTSGYDTGFRISAQGSLNNGKPQAILWSGMRQESLGQGVAWSVGHGGVVVGDDRASSTAWGNPTCWSNRRWTRLSPRRGSAFAINATGVIVGTYEQGGFVALLGCRSNAAQSLDGLLRDRRWHIRSAYRISTNGTILALGSRAGSALSLVLLKPVATVRSTR